MGQTEEPDLNSLKRLLRRSEEVDVNERTDATPPLSPQEWKTRVELERAISPEPAPVNRKSGLSEMRRDPADGRSRPVPVLPQGLLAAALPSGPVSTGAMASPLLPLGTEETSRRSAGAVPATPAQGVSKGRRSALGRFPILLTIALTTAISTAVTVLVFKPGIAPQFASSAEQAEREWASVRPPSPHSGQLESAQDSTIAPGPAIAPMQKKAAAQPDAAAKYGTAQERPAATDPAPQELPVAEPSVSDATIGTPPSAPPPEPANASQSAAQARLHTEAQDATIAGPPVPDQSTTQASGASTTEHNLLFTPESWVLAAGARRRIPIALSSAADGKSYQVLISGLESDAIVKNATRGVTGVWLLEGRQLAAVELKRGAAPPAILPVTVKLQNADGKEIERRIFRLLTRFSEAR